MEWLFQNQRKRENAAKARVAMEERTASDLHAEIITRFRGKSGPLEKLRPPPLYMLHVMTQKTQTPAEAEMLLEVHREYVKAQHPIKQSGKPPLFVALLRTRHWDALLDAMETKGKLQVFFTNARILGDIHNAITEDKQWPQLQRFCRLLPKALNPECPAPTWVIKRCLAELARSAPELALISLRESVAAGVSLQADCFFQVMRPLLAQGKNDEAMSVLALLRSAGQAPITHPGTAAVRVKSPGQTVCRRPANAGLVHLALRAAAAARATAPDADISDAVAVLRAATPEERTRGKTSALGLPSEQWEEGRCVATGELLAEEALPVEVVEALALPEASAA